MRRKTTAIATTLAMILSLLPVGALPSWAAAEIINMENVESDVIISGTHSGECPGHTFTRRSTKHRIIVEGGTHTITFENNAGVNLSGRDDDEACALSIREGANVTLIVSSESTLKSGGDCAGIAVDGGTVTISGSSTVNATGGGTGGAGIAVDGGTVRIQGGTVKAKGGSGGAGITIGAGGNVMIQGGTVNATGGTVNATGGSGGAGIATGAGGNVTIQSGTVDANGGSGGAGITTGAGGTVVITGGTVTATGAGGGAGIGGCAGGDSAGAVNIQGGSVTATGAGGGAGIGGGAGGASAGNVNIQSGSVTATGSGGGAGIGGGAGGESKATPTINGGTVTATGGDGDGAGIGDTVGISLLGGKAVVFASSISKISDNWQGIAFVGNDGQVYGDFTLPRNLPVESGHTLTIPEDATLTIPSGRTLTIAEGATLINNGTITGDGTLAGTGTVSGSGTVSVKDNQFAKDSSLTLSAKPSTVTAGDEVTLTAELSSTDGSVNDKPITFSVNGKEIGKATTDDGTATLETTASTSDWQYGDNTVTATFAGDMNLAASTGTATVTMDKLTPKISVSGQATGPTTVELDAATLDPAVANGKVEYAVNTTNTAPTDGWQEGTTFSGLTANTTYYFFARVTGSNDYADATSAGVAITTLPEITTTTLDDGTVGVAYEATLEANPAENVTWTISKGTLPDDLNLEGDKISGTPTKAGDYTFTVQVTTNGGVSATQELNLTIGKGTQAAPDAPTAESVSANSVTLKEIKGAEYGYTTGNEQSVPEDRWQSSTTFDKLEAGTTYTFYARYAGNNDYEVSPASKGTAITTLPEIITTTLDDGTVGVEYKATLEADSGENVTWTISKGSLPDGLMLNENTGVIFGTPKKAVTNHIFTVQAIAHGGARVTKELQLTIGKGAQNAPAAPTAESVSANSVTLQEIAGAEYGYTTGNEQSVPEDRWQSSTTFDKLEAGTTYTFYARLAKNDDYDASPASTGIAIATAPEASAVGINYAAETLSFAESLEVNTAEDFSDTAIGSGDSITTYIGKTLYVRVKATDKVPASAAVAVRIPARPDAPKLRVSNESIDGKHDGQITGVTAAMEYQKQGDTSWTACDGETITDLAPGTYEVRLKATENDFAGTPATVEIKTGAERTYTLNVTAPTFDSVTTGYAQPEAKAIAITSTGNSDATIDSVAVDSSDFAIAEGDKSVTAGGTNESWTIHPAADLAAGTYTATVTVTYDAGATATTAVSFTVNRPSSGGGGTITPPTYPPTVTEPDNGSVTTSPARPKQGETVTITPDPDEGYEVDNITVTDKNGKTIDVEKNTDGTYSFIQPSGKVTITVIYREAGEEPEPSALPFTDVSEGAWYIDPVRFVYSEGLMTGTSATTFSPNLTTTRGMIVAILYRMEGEPDLSGENLGVPFADVDANAYYSDAVYWARMNGIVSGYSSESFGPTDSITREQLAAILYNVAAYKGVDTSARNDLSAYTDSGHLSGWATDAMQWANAAGIANGMSATELAPKGNATRAQVAAMLQRYITNVIS